jgi:enoyl-CoA hydratase/carnithine racemase
MHSDFPSLLSDRKDSTITITMNRPDQRNVLTLALLNELIVAFSEAGDSDVTGVILAGEGKVFCAGHDFSELFDAGLDKARQLFATCTKLMETMQSIPQPVVARVHALATGAGCQLVATADLAVASDQATFCTPGGKGGLFCTTPLVSVSRSIGPKRALEMAMSGDPIDANTALQWGLVNKVVAPEQLISGTNEFLASMTRGSAESKGIGKKAFYVQLELDQRAAYDHAIDVMARASQTPDSQEGIAAFKEKRAPVWTSDASLST